MPPAVPPPSVPTTKRRQPERSESRCTFSPVKQDTYGSATSSKSSKRRECKLGGRTSPRFRRCHSHEVDVRTGHRRQFSPILAGPRKLCAGLHAGCWGCACPRRYGGRRLRGVAVLLTTALVSQSRRRDSAIRSSRVTNPRGSLKPTVCACRSGAHCGPVGVSLS